MLGFCTIQDCLVFYSANAARLQLDLARQIARITGINPLVEYLGSFRQISTQEASVAVQRPMETTDLR